MTLDDVINWLIYFVASSNGSSIKDKMFVSLTEFSLLTLSMLNCFKDHKRYIHILNHILNLASPK